MIDLPHNGRRVNEDASPDAGERHKAVLRARIERERSEHSHKLFEEFCAARDAERAADAAEPAQWGEAA